MSSPAMNELDRLKSSFLAIVSHELRTPLTEILTATSILRDGSGKLDDKQLPYLQVIETSAARLDQLILDLITFAQIQSDVTETQLELGYINDLANATIDLYRGQLERKRLHIIPRLARDLPPTRFDRLKMHRVFANLISNAVNFTHEGGKVIVKTRADGHWQLFEVLDNGVGIPAEKQPHIFESFYQVEDPLIRKVGGLGLGLAYAHEVVVAHNGRITFESIEGRGSLFSVWLPSYTGDNNSVQRTAQ